MSARADLDRIRAQLSCARLAQAPGDELDRLIQAEIQAHLDAVDEAQPSPGLRRSSRLADRQPRRTRSLAPKIARPGASWGPTCHRHPDVRLPCPTCD